MPEIKDLVYVQLVRMFQEQSNVPWDQGGKRNNMQCSFVTKAAEKMGYM